MPLVNPSASASAATTSALGTVKLGSPPRDTESPVLSVQRLTADRWVPRRHIFTNFAGDATKSVTAAAATDIFTCTAHGYKPGDLVVFTALTGGAGITAGLPYFVIATNLAANTFSVSPTPGGTILDVTTDLTVGTVGRKRDGTLFDFVAPGGAAATMLYTTSSARPAIRAADGGTGTTAQLLSKITDFKDWDVRVRFRPANDTSTASTDYGPGLVGGWEDNANYWQATHYFAAAQATLHSVVGGTDVSSTVVGGGVPTSPLSTSQDRMIRMQKRGDLIRYKTWATNVAEPGWLWERRVRPPILGPSPNTTTDNPERGSFGLSQIFCGSYFLEFSATELVRESANMLHNADLSIIDGAMSSDIPKAVTGVASTGVFTSSSHGYSVGDAVGFGGLPVQTQGYGIDPIRTYYVAAVTTNTFTVAKTRGGGAITFTTDIPSGYVLRNPVPAFWARPTAALLSGNYLEVAYVAGPDGAIRPALSMVGATANDPNLSWYQYLWNPLNCSGAGATNSRLAPHPQSIPARRMEFSAWVKGQITAVQAAGLGLTFDVYMYDAYSVALLMERQTYHPGLSPTTLNDAGVDLASYDGAQTVSTFGWTFLTSIIEVPQYSSLHQMRGQILFHEAVDTGNILVMDPCLRAID